MASSVPRVGALAYASSINLVGEWNTILSSLFWSFNSSLTAYFQVLCIFATLAIFFPFKYISARVSKPSILDNLFACKVRKVNLVRLVKLTYQNKCGHILALINNKYNLNIPEKYVVTLNKVLDIAKLNFLRQMDAKKIISETLKENEIRHLYIKWADIVDNINVDPYIRTANDIDIYIEEKHIDKIRDIFIDVFDGVETPSDTSIHYAFTLRKLGVHVEVHHKLLDKYLSSVTSILSDPFKHGYIDKNNHYLYHLTKEYYYLYNLAHLSKHTLFCELYFNIIFDMNYLINDSSINKEMVNDLIKKAKLEDFHKFIKGYISYLLTDSLQSYEVYAYERYMMYNHKNKNIVYQKRKYKTKFSYLWHKVFLPYKELCFIFPKLKKHKLLLPIYQVKRWCIRLKDNRMKNVKYELDHFSSILTNEELNNIYSSIGLKEVHDLLKKVA